MSEPYRIDPTKVEHGCCWRTAIVREKTEEEFKNSPFKTVLVCECDEDIAQIICNALNKHVSEQPSK